MAAGPGLEFMLCPHWRWPLGTWMENGEIPQTTKEKKKQNKTKLTLPENLFHHRNNRRASPTVLGKAMEKVDTKEAR